MLALNDEVNVHLYLDHVDMRKAIDGLCQLLSGELDQNPQSGDVFLFRNRACNKVKILAWHKNGFVMHYKRLERGKFKFPKAANSQHMMISHEQLSWLLAGLDFIVMQQFPEINFENYF